jgi:hypothetical protein
MLYRNRVLAGCRHRRRVRQVSVSHRQLSSAIDCISTVSSGETDLKKSIADCVSLLQSRSAHPPSFAFVQTANHSWADHSTFNIPQDWVVIGCTSAGMWSTPTVYTRVPFTQSVPTLTMTGVWLGEGMQARPFYNTDTSLPNLDLSDKELGQLLAGQEDVAFLTMSHPLFEGTIELQDRLETVFPESPSAGIVAGTHGSEVFLLNTKTLSSTRGEVTSHAVRNEGVVGIAVTGPGISLDDFVQLTTESFSTMQCAGFYSCEKFSSSVFVPSALKIGDQPTPVLPWETETGGDAPASADGAEHDAEHAADGAQSLHSMGLFRLGAPIFPGSIVSCRILEPRYRLMIKRATEELSNGEAPQPFGIISGAGVGAVGTMVHVENVTQVLADGRSVLQLRGLRRFRVESEAVAEGTFGLSVAQVSFFSDDGDDDGDYGDVQGVSALWGEGAHLQRTLGAQTERRKAGDKASGDMASDIASGGISTVADDEDVEKQLLGGATPEEKMSVLELMAQV